MLNKLEIKTLDIKSQVFDKEKDALSLFPLRKHHHYNPKGYKKVASFIFKSTIN